MLPHRGAAMWASCVVQPKNKQKVYDKQPQESGGRNGDIKINFEGCGA